jgi:NTE family protein
MNDNSCRKIGLALSGGGAKGGAHLGILRVFDEYGIKISRIIGVSSGSILGAAYCLGMDLKDIDKWSNKFKKLKPFSLRNLNFFGDSISKSKNLEKLIKELVGNATFEDCRIPYEILAVNLESGEEVLFNEGFLWEAIMASSAIPGLYSPRFINGKYLADGGILNNMPVSQLRVHKDIDIVIGIDPGFSATKQCLSGLIWEKYYRKPRSLRLEPGFFEKIKLNHSLLVSNILRAIDLTRDESQMRRIEEAAPDVILYPNTSAVSIFDFDQYNQAIQAGIDSAIEAMPKILQLISENGVKKDNKEEKDSISVF